MEPPTRTPLSPIALFSRRKCAELFLFDFPKGFLPPSEKEGRCLRAPAAFATSKPVRTGTPDHARNVHARNAQSLRDGMHKIGRARRGIRCEMGGTASSVGCSVGSTRSCSSDTEGMARSRLARKCRLASGQGSCSCHDGSCTAGLHVAVGAQ